jgi:hypothetical protein
MVLKVVTGKILETWELERVSVCAIPLWNLQSFTLSKIVIISQIIIYMAYYHIFRMRSMHASAGVRFQFGHCESGNVGTRIPASHPQLCWDHFFALKNLRSKGYAWCQSTRIRPASGCTGFSSTLNVSGKIADGTSSKADSPPHSQSSPMPLDSARSSFHPSANDAGARELAEMN